VNYHDHSKHPVEPNEVLEGLKILQRLISPAMIAVEYQTERTRQGREIDHVSLMRQEAQSQTEKALHHPYRLLDVETSDTPEY
jgi:hypothetical protein